MKDVFDQAMAEQGVSDIPCEIGSLTEAAKVRQTIEALGIDPSKTFVITYHIVQEVLKFEGVTITSLIQEWTAEFGYFAFCDMYQRPDTLIRDRAEYLPVPEVMLANAMSEQKLRTQAEVDDDIEASGAEVMDFQAFIDMHHGGSKHPRFYIGVFRAQAA